MEVKIKDKDGYVEADWTIEDGILVVSPKKVKFEPKGGDVIVGGGDTRFIAIFNKMRFDYSFFYHALLVLDGDKRPQLNSWAYFLNVRPATEEEKKKLFGKLTEEGYEWKPDTKELIKLKWRPKEGEEFWLPIYYTAPVEFKPITSLLNKGRDKVILDKGWVFKTKEECQEFCNRLNDAINSVKP